MLILIDGYNVIAPVKLAGKTPKSDWLHQERMRLLIRLAEKLDPELAINTCVVFDAATRRRGVATAASQHGATSRFRGIEVRFAIDHDEADDLIEELIAVHSSPKRLTVVSSDHRLQAAARRSGAVAFDSDQWLDSLLDGHVLLAIGWPPHSREIDAGDGGAGNHRHDPKSLLVDAATVDEWLRAFGVTPETASPPSRVAPATPATEQLAETQQPGVDPGISTHRPLEKGGNPRRSLDSDNPFPDGYGEDLL